MTQAFVNRQPTRRETGSREPTPERAMLVVNADDLGMAESVNTAVFLAHRHGIVTSASLAVTTPASEQAAAELPHHPSLGIGLHFCLSAGRAVAGPRAVPDLVDSDGFLRRRFGSLQLALSGRGRHALSRQIAVELEAQIERARSLGAELDHISSERHVHLIPRVFELVAESAERHGIPHVRIIDDIGARYLSAADLCRATFDGGVVKSWLLGRWTRRGRRFRGVAEGPDVKFASLLCTGRLDRVLPAIWRNPPAGVTEVAVHPGFPAGEAAVEELRNRHLSRYLASPDRWTEAGICLSLKRSETTARLATFAEVYGLRAPAFVAEALAQPEEADVR